MGYKNQTELDNPSIHTFRRKVIEKKKFLHNIYRDWYQLINSKLQPASKVVLELGSGAGLIKDFIPGALTSDIIFLPFINLVLDGRKLPLAGNRIDGLVLVNVFHHIPNVYHFLQKASGVIKTGGRIVMIEPWMTTWSRWIYANFHHETLDANVRDWDFTASGPMSGSNQALPWIVFSRDRQKFEYKFPNLVIKEIKPIMPLSYLLSGGFRAKLSVPAFSYSFFRRMEDKLFNAEKMGMFALIVLEKVG